MGNEDKKASKEKLEKTNKELPKSAKDFEYQLPAAMTIEDGEKELNDLIDSLEKFASVWSETLTSKVIGKIQDLIADLKKIELR